MRVIARKALRDYWQREPAAEQELKAWFAEAENAGWKTPAEVKAKYGNASILKAGRVVFNKRYDIPESLRQFSVQTYHNLQIAEVLNTGTSRSDGRRWNYFLPARYSLMAAPAMRPCPIARITVAAPSTISPPA